MALQLLRESIAEHKPHIDKLLKIGPQLAELSVQEGATVTQRYSDAERRYKAIKEGVKGRATVLDEAVSQSAQVRYGCQMNKLLNFWITLILNTESHDHMIFQVFNDEPQPMHLSALSRVAVVVI